MISNIFIALFLVPSVVLSVELSVIWDSKIQSYGLRKGKVDGYISLLNFKNDVNKTGQVLAYVYIELSSFLLSFSFGMAYAPFACPR